MSKAQRRRNSRKEELRRRSKDYRRPPRHPSNLKKHQEIKAWYRELKAEKWAEGKQRRQHLLKSMTEAERVLAGLLSEFGLKYRREWMIQLRDYSVKFIDFYVPAGKLGFEADGGYHRGRVDYDADRDLGIMSHNILMVRFTNEEILGDGDGVREKIEAALRGRAEWWKRNAGHAGPLTKWLKEAQGVYRG